MKHVFWGPRLKVLLAFTALRLEYGWATTPITSNKLKAVTKGLSN